MIQKLYGWYSQKSVLDGQNIYKYTDINGIIVSCSIINNSNTNGYSNNSIYKKDEYCIGQVVKYISTIKNINKLYK